MSGNQQSRSRDSAWRTLALLVASLMVLGVAPRVAAEERVAFRFALTRSTLGDIGHNDAVAALKVWAGEMVKTFPKPVDVEVFILAGAREVREAMAAGKLDGATASAAEFLEIGVRPKNLYVIRRNGVLPVSYRLLVHRESGFTLRALLDKGTIAMPRTAVYALAGEWIEGLRRKHAPELSSRPNLMVEAPNAAKAILRVYFKQAPACLATEEAFRVACELNPQIGKVIAPLEVSPEVIPSVFFVRDDLRDDLRLEIERRYFSENAPVSIKQVLTVFQGDLIVRLTLDEWQPTLALVKEWLGTTTQETAP